MSPCPFPTTITITPRAPPYIYIYIWRCPWCNGYRSIYDWDIQSELWRMNSKSIFLIYLYPSLLSFFPYFYFSFLVGWLTLIQITSKWQTRSHPSNVYIYTRYFKIMNSRLYHSFVSIPLWDRLFYYIDVNLRKIASIPANLLRQGPYQVYC